MDLVHILDQEGFYQPLRLTSTNPKTPSKAAASAKPAASSLSTTSGSGGNGPPSAPRSSSPASSNASPPSSSSSAAPVASVANFGLPKPLQMPTIRELDAAMEEGGLTLLRRAVSEKEPAVCMCACGPFNGAVWVFSSRPLLPRSSQRLFRCLPFLFSSSPSCR